jgi:hypothetical protein
VNDSLLGSFHSEPAHDGERCDILRLGTGFHRSQIKAFESGSHSGEYCFCRVALPVVILTNLVAEVPSVRTSRHASDTNVAYSCLVGSALYQKINRFSRGSCMYCLDNLGCNGFFARHP